MHAASRIFDHDLCLLVRRRQNEIGMIDPVFPAISHPDNEGLKRRGAQEFANPRFHARMLEQGAKFVTSGKSACLQRFTCQTHTCV